MEYRVQVKPNSSRGPLVVEAEDGLTVYLREKAIDGAANDALIKTLAAHFDVPKTRVQIKRGATGRHKTVIIDK